MSTPLTEIARSIDGTIIEPAEYGGIPAHFGDLESDYRAAITGAALFDRTPQGKVDVSGKDAPAFLHNLSTNDIISLPVGGGCETYFCDHRARVLAHAFVYHWFDEVTHAFWLDVAAGFSERIIQHLDRHLISESVVLADRTKEFAQMHLCGPGASAVLEKAIEKSLPELSEFQHVERVIDSAVCQICRHDSLGMPGFDIVCGNRFAAQVWNTLRSFGASPAGEATFDVLRVEAGTPVFGIDIDENRFVMEVARAQRAVSYSKGCYLGQEPIVMSRDRAGFVNRAFLGVKVLESGTLPPGTKLFRDGNEVGLVTSSVVSPRLNAPLALAYIRRGNQDVGLRLEAETPEGKRAVEVLGFPPVT